MRDSIIRRRQALEVEYQVGKKLLDEYEERQRNLRETLLRISGAIQVLEEVLAEQNRETNGEESQPYETKDDQNTLEVPTTSGEGT